MAEVLRPTLTERKGSALFISLLLVEIIGFLIYGKQQKMQKTGNDLDLLLLTILD